MSLPFSAHVLIIDDEPSFLISSKTLLRSAGISHIITEQDSRNVKKQIQDNQIATVLLDLTMPYKSGMDILKEINTQHPGIPVLVVSGKNELDTAVECMRYGAFDYLVKPVERSRFVSAVKRALEVYQLRHEIDSLRTHLLSNQVVQHPAFNEIKTQSSKMHSIFRYVDVIAKTQEPIMITGETGVGKELIARAIHTLSELKGPFVDVNLAGLDDTMFSDTLFGHKKGAYTGAADNREGLIAKADKGTLFLDEIGDLNEQSQVKLLRLLQEKSYYPLGSDVAKSSHARIVVATNKTPEELQAGTIFRQDLYYRLCAHQMSIPPLRERKEDIPLLVDQFIKESADKLDKKPPAIPNELYTLLKIYAFPGNIRELRAMVFDAMARHQSGILSLNRFKELIDIQKSSLQLETTQENEQTAPWFQPDAYHFPTLKEAEGIIIQDALNRTEGNQSLAANLLGISRQALNKRLSRKSNA